MDIIKLSPRLETAAKLIGRAEFAVDVGTDHGYLPVWLVQTGAAGRVTASDVKPAPLSRARLSAERHGVADKLDFVLADGLGFDGAESADCAVMCGMGGETIMGILAAAPWTKEGVRLILQPQTKADELCLWLRAEGYRLADAALARDAGRLYIIMAYTGGAGEAPLFPEEILLKKRDPLLSDWLCHRIGLLEAALAGAAKSPKAPDMSAELAALEWLGKLKEELENA